jgi:hypothetical protein
LIYKQWYGFFNNGLVASISETLKFITMNMQEQITTGANDYTLMDSNYGARIKTDYNHTRNFFIVVVLIEVVALLIASII